MPATRHKFQCGHKGHGAFCHRCAEAARMQSFADGKAKPKEGSFKGMDKAWFAEQAKNLRSLPRGGSVVVIPE